MAIPTATLARRGPPPPRPRFASPARGQNADPRTTQRAPEPSEFANIFHSLGTELDRGEAAMHAITRGTGAGAAQLSTTDLLALQARVYRYSEAIDLAAKLVDRASNGVKTLLTGQ